MYGLSDKEREGREGDLRDKKAERERERELQTRRQEDGWMDDRWNIQK